MALAFRFANNQWSLWVWGLLALIGLLGWLHLRRRESLRDFVLPEMQKRLARRVSAGRQVASYVFVSLAALALLLACMRPQVEGGMRNVRKVGAQIMVCLDVSRSMLAEDAAPNRLERAKADLSDLLTYLDGDQVGLIAFAGNARLVCPMTTDFGFLRLVLDHVGPHTVGRGGTRLEEPIRRATESFSPAGDLSRVMLLITDGEDHDSYPLEAAELARERGVRVLTIGFGSEAGTPIEYTDPVDKTRHVVRDADDQIVTSRLDGDTLREIALKTDGAYIPAGTGNLDLSSIHAKHIAPLLRGSVSSQQRTVYRDLYQWFAVATFPLLLIGLALRSSHSTHRGGLPVSMTSPLVRKSLLMVVLLFGRFQPLVHGALPGSTTNPPNGIVTRPAAADVNHVTPIDETPREPDSDPQQPAPDVPGDENPRTTYNRAVRKMDDHAEEAIALFATAAERADTDASLRFACFYNLGWSTARFAERYVDEEPQKSLRLLQDAAQHLQQAIRIRPEEPDARYNLEIVMRRIIQVSDAIAQKEAPTIETDLAELLSRQRELLHAAGTLVQQHRNLAAVDASESEPLVRQFRQLATRQRLIRSDTESLLADLLAEVDRKEAEADTASQRGAPGGAGAAAPGDEDDPPGNQAAARAYILRAAAQSLRPAIQRMGQARRDLRLRQGGRAVRRTSYAFQALRSAQDQLQPPDQRLKLLLAEAQQQLQQTRQLADFRRSDQEQNASALPVWLTVDLLADTQQLYNDRLGNLRELISIYATRTESDDQTVQQPTDPDWPEIGSRVESALSEFDATLRHLQADTPRPAAESLATGIEHLSNAVEFLLDLRGMIETTYQYELFLQQLLEASGRIAPANRSDLFSQGALLQTKNLTRIDRIETMVNERLSQLDESLPQGPATPGGIGPAAPPAAGVDTEDERTAAEVARLQHAQRLVAMARQQMTEALDQLGEETVGRNASETDVAPRPAETPQEPPGENEPEQPDVTEPEERAEDADSASPKQSGSFLTRNLWNGASALAQRLRQAATGQPYPLPESHTSVVSTNKVLNDLRRLFFSIVEHLQETAQRQTTLREESDLLRAEPDHDAVRHRWDPLRATQHELAAITGEIAEGLSEMQQQVAQQPSPSGSTHTSAPARYGEASELVYTAKQSMESALRDMTSLDDPEAMAVHQQEAEEKLWKAVELLQPDDQQHSPDSSPDNEDQEESSDDNSQQDQSPQNQDMGSQQLLQMVRDRDAKRQESQNRRGAGQTSVLKDW